MSQVKKLLGQTVVYGLSSVLGRILNYLLVPLYTAVFAPDEYGIITELYAYVAFLNILYSYGLETAFFRFHKEGSHVFNTAFISILCSSLLFSTLIWVFSDSLASRLDYRELGYLIRCLAVILAIDTCVVLPFAQLRLDGKAHVFALFKLTNIGLNIGLNLFFILLCPWLLQQGFSFPITYIYDAEIGIGYVVISNLMANVIYLILFIPQWRRVHLTFSSRTWIKIMKYATPILVVGFAGVINDMLSRVLLRHRLIEDLYPSYSNLEIVGIFGACYKLSVFMVLSVQAFRYAFEPFFFSRAGQKDSPFLFSQVMTAFVSFGALSWLGLSLFLPFYAPLFLRQTDYLLALDAVPWLLGGALLLGIFYNLSLWYKLSDKTHFGALISLSGAFLTLVLNWYLIPIFGFMGSAYATFFSYLFMVVVSYFLGRKIYPIPYKTLKIIMILSVSGGGIFLGDFLQYSFLSSSIIFSVCTFIVWNMVRDDIKRVE